MCFLLIGVFGMRLEEVFGVFEEKPNRCYWAKSEFSDAYKRAGSFAKLLTKKEEYPEFFDSLKKGKGWHISRHWRLVSVKSVGR